MMETLRLNPNPPKLRIRRIFQEAVAFSWGLRQKLWKWIVIGALLAGLPDFLGLFEDINVERGDEVGGGAGLSPAIIFILLCVSLIPSALIFVILAVYCHRSILKRAIDGEDYLRFVFTRRERKFFSWSIALFFLAALLTVPIMMVLLSLVFLTNELYPNSLWGSPFMVFGLPNLWIVPLYYVIGRWSLIFPALAVDCDTTLGWSWRQTKGNGWHMFILVGFLPGIAIIFGTYSSYVWATDFSVAINYFMSFLWFFLTPLEIALISIAFRELTNWKLVRQAELA